MEKIYRVVFSQALGQYVVASELAKGRQKSSSAGRALVVAGSVLGASWALANGLPQGAQVVSGSATVSTSGANMQVQQSSQRAILNWQDFSIGAGNKVKFVQPSASAVALNRVLGANPSVIQGNLSANGQVFLINPNGVLFGPSSQVSVGALLASTLSMSNSDFLAGRYVLKGDSGQSVVNQGTLQAQPGGFVSLIAAKVENAGQITANQGSVLLGAGSEVTLDLNGPVKLRVDAAALDAQIANGGAIQADGGLVLLNARATSESSCEGRSSTRAAASARRPWSPEKRARSICSVTCNTTQSRLAARSTHRLRAVVRVASLKPRPRRSTPAAVW